MKSKKFLIMAGGTGGHVFPALAIAKKLKDEGHEILWLGTKGRMEEKLVPKYGFDIKFIDVKGIRGNGLARKLVAPFMILKACLQSYKVIRAYKPDLSLGMGGYASGPGGLVSYLLGIPLVLHEQNAKAGLTNKLLSKIAKLILLGFEGAFVGSNVHVVGNPVRDEIVKLDGQKRDFSNTKLRVLVVGGSLGAKALNDMLPSIFAQFSDKSLKVTHQVGANNSQKVKDLYKSTNVDVEVVDFIDNMAKAYTEHDLIICRAGALTVSEVLAANIPAIFVPLPTAVDDHQRLNASYCVKYGAARLVLQKDLKEKMIVELQDLLENREKLQDMSIKAHEICILDAGIKSIKLMMPLIKD